MATRSWLRGTPSVIAALAVLLGPAAVRADQSPPGAHLVQPGETLSQIALDANTDAASLAALNGLDDPNAIVAGQSLKLPDPAAPARSGAAGASAASGGAAAAATSSSASTVRSYAVADGDTLWGIAQQFGTSAQALADLNALDDPGHLALGQVLALPAGVPSTSAQPSPAPAARRSVSVSYTVQPGETLGQIAHQFDVRADSIVQASGLTDANKLSIGSMLKIPVPGKEHVVTAGETLRDIAASEKVDLGSLIDFNQIDDPGLIRVGQVVVVPVPAAQPASTPTVVAAEAPTAAMAPTAAPASTSTPSPAATPTPTPTRTPKPAPPLAIVAPPRGAPTDGLAGAALKLLGSPYVWGGSNPNGFDCSGFVWYVGRQVAKPLTRGLFGQYNSGSHPGRDELKPGDLVFFQNTYSNGLSHNGIYIGNNQFVHAADESAGVTISSLSTAYWSSHWFGATRLP